MCVEEEQFESTVGVREDHSLSHFTNLLLHVLLRAVVKKGHNMRL